MDEGNDKPKLKLIQGGRHSRLAIGPVEIFVGPQNMAPYAVEAVVAEEDTFLVLSSDPELLESRENPIKVMTEVVEARPEKPGSVLIRGGRPLQLLAIVHDLNQEPSWKEKWVASALDGIFHEVESRKIRSLALPLLGTVHGRLEKERFLFLLREALERRTFDFLQRLWLVVPVGAALEILKILRAQLKI